MSNAEALPRFVKPYFEEIGWPFLVTVYVATLGTMLAFTLVWGLALLALLFVGPAYAFFVGRLCARAMGNRGIIKDAIHIILAMVTQVVFVIVVFWAVSAMYNGAIAYLCFIGVCAAGPVGTWIGPVLLDVVRLKARPSSAC